MAIDPLQTLDIIETMEYYLDKNRPALDIRDQLDINYRIENQSIILFEIRPSFVNPSESRHLDYAKTTFVKSRNIWKIYWMRASGWYPYRPAEMKSFKRFLREVEADPFGCFKG